MPETRYDHRPIRRRRMPVFTMCSVLYCTRVYECVSVCVCVRASGWAFANVNVDCLCEWMRVCECWWTLSCTANEMTWMRTFRKLFQIHAEIIHISNCTTVHKSYLVRHRRQTHFRVDLKAKFNEPMRIGVWMSHHHTYTAHTAVSNALWCEQQRFRYYFDLLCSARLVRVYRMFILHLV